MRLHTEHLHTVLLQMASVYTHTESFLNREAFTHREAFTQRIFYTQQAFTHSKRLHTEHLRTVLLHMASVYSHRSFYTETLLHTEKLLHTASFYTQNLLHTASFYRKKFLHREAFLYIITTGIAAPKLDLDAKATKRRF